MGYCLFKVASGFEKESFFSSNTLLNWKMNTNQKEGQIYKLVISSFLSIHHLWSEDCSVEKNVWNSAAFCSQSADVLCRSDLSMSSHIVRSNSKHFFLFSPPPTNRNDKLEERGAGSGSKARTGQESVRWVRPFAPHCLARVSSCPSAWRSRCSLLSDEEPVLMVWNSTLPMEVKDLKRHCEKRKQIAAKMREQLQHDWVARL